MMMMAFDAMAAALDDYLYANHHAISDDSRPYYFVQCVPKTIGARYKKYFCCPTRTFVGVKFLLVFLSASLK
jgi:hypothetical protein